MQFISYIVSSEVAGLPSFPMLPDLIFSQLRQNEKMLWKIFEGISDSELDFRPLPTALSLREHLGHLCAGCEALMAIRQGREYDWDNIASHGSTVLELLSKFRQLRLEALPAGESINLEAASLLSDYLILHEAYHIGQLALSRKALDPSWDSLKLYA